MQQFRDYNVTKGILSHIFPVHGTEYLFLISMASNHKLWQVFFISMLWCAFLVHCCLEKHVIAWMDVVSDLKQL